MFESVHVFILEYMHLVTYLYLYLYIRYIKVIKQVRKQKNYLIFDLVPTVLFNEDGGNPELDHSLPRLAVIKHAPSILFWPFKFIECRISPGKHALERR